MKRFGICLAIGAVLLTACKDREKHNNPATKNAGGGAEYAIDDQRVYFDYDSARISDDARGELMDQAEFLKQNEDIKIVIGGHCDERGTREYNMALGARRAHAAAGVITGDGQISESRVRTVSYGKDNPQVAGSGEEVWRLNRNATTNVD